MSGVKSYCLTVGPRPKLPDWRDGEGVGTHGVGVKSVDIVGNTKGEGKLLAIS